MRRLLSLLAVAGMAVPAMASASVTVGPASPNPDPLMTQGVNYGEAVMFVTATGPAGSQLVSPISGIVTRWRFYTDKITGPGATAQLRTLAPAGGATYTAIASGPEEPLAEVEPSGSAFHNVFHEFPARLPITPGQTVGIVFRRPAGSLVIPITAFFSGVGWSTVCMGPTCGGDEAVPPDGSSGTGSTMTDAFTAFNADVEPDADGDGFGDETQDNCPGVANPSQADADGDGRGDACDREQISAGQPSSPPRTTLAKGSRKFKARGRRARVRFKFSSPDVNATFECSLDGKPFRACASPSTYRLGPGTHSFQVRAKNSAGTVDPTPAGRAFKVVHPRRRHRH